MKYFKTARPSFTCPQDADVCGLSSLISHRQTVTWGHRSPERDYQSWNIWSCRHFVDLKFLHRESCDPLVSTATPGCLPDSHLQAWTRTSKGGRHHEDLCRCLSMSEASYEGMGTVCSKVWNDFILSDKTVAEIGIKRLFYCFMLL